MQSIRPSVFNQRERLDGGPFLLFEPAVEGDDASIDVIFTDTPPDQQVGDFPMARLLRVSPDIVRIFPLNVQQARDDYLTPKYGHLESIHVSRRIDRPYELPATVEDVDALLEGLPDGFAKDYRYGLGFLWEYRAIAEVFGDMDKITLMIVHGGNETTLDPPFFMLGVKRFHEVRKEIKRISARYQRDAKRDKDQYAYHMLLHAADAEQFPRLKKTLRTDALADVTGGGRDRVELSKRDRRAAVGLVRSNLQALASSDTEALLSLKSDIEQVTLQQLIDRFRELLAKDAAEGRWQSFLQQNPFILSLAFSVPAIVIQDQAYVGGKRLHGRGGRSLTFSVRPLQQAVSRSSRSRSQLPNCCRLPLIEGTTCLAPHRNSAGRLSKCWISGQSSCARCQY